MDFGRPTNRGMTMCGKTTTSRNGRRGSDCGSVVNVGHHVLREVSGDMGTVPGFFKKHTLFCSAVPGRPGRPGGYAGRTCRGSDGRLSRALRASLRDNGDRSNPPCPPFVRRTGGTHTRGRRGASARPPAMPGGQSAQRVGHRGRAAGAGTGKITPGAWPEKKSPGVGRGVGATARHRGLCTRAYLVPATFGACRRRAPAACRRPSIAFSSMTTFSAFGQAAAARTSLSSRARARGSSAGRARPPCA